MSPYGARRGLALFGAWGFVQSHVHSLFVPLPPPPQLLPPTGDTSCHQVQQPQPRIGLQVHPVAHRADAAVYARAAVQDHP